MAPSGITELVGEAQRLVAAGQAAHAAELYRDWILRQPADPLLHVVQFNRGVLLAGLQDLAGAAHCFGEAIGLNPGFLPPYINLGAIYERVGAAGPALSHWAHVTGSLAAVTGDAVTYKITALKQAAQLLEGQQRLAEAEDALRQILELGPRPRDVMQHLVSLRQRQCRWPLLVPVGGLQPAELLAAMAPLSLANYTDDPLLQLANAASYSRQDVGRPERFRTTADVLARPAAADGRLRIGYLSSDLRGHAIGYLMAELFGLHDRGSFEVFVYYCGIPQEDATKQRIRDSVEHWTSIAELDDDAAEQRILADGIDILVDVNGHTRSARTRLLARRPAPVIVNWLGFPGSMGSPTHHYIIADDVIIPPGHEHYYSERVLRLPCYQPNDRRRAVADRVPSRAEAGLPETGVVFCSFNGPQKITPFGFARWMEILRQVPGSVLWLLQGNAAVDVALRGMAEQAGIAPDRLVFAPLAANPDHVARYALADLFLDTSPYGAHTTASDALWMGVPVLTMPGRCFASRVCASLVRAAGLPELVVEGAEAYVAQAVALGRDPARLAALRARLLAGRDTALLFDTPRCVGALEALFRRIWAEFQAGALPRPALDNLDLYLEIGAAMDHDAAEFSGLADYEARYREALATRDGFQAVPPDGRLWRRGLAA